MVDPSVDPEELRYAPRAPRRLLWLRRTALVVALLAIIGGGLAIAYSWSQSQYFVSAHGKQVAIYRGVDAQLPGISLNHVYADQDLTLKALPAFRRSQVKDGLPADSLAKAERIVEELRGFAKSCAKPGGSSTVTTLPPPRTPSIQTPSTPTSSGRAPSSQAPSGHGSPFDADVCPAQRANRGDRDDRDPSPSGPSTSGSAIEPPTSLVPPGDRLRRL